MTIERKLLGTSPSGDAPNVADVFSTDLYLGNGGTGQTITTGMNIVDDGAEGLVWIKARNAATSFFMVDTINTATKSLRSDTNHASQHRTADFNGFTSSGFTVDLAQTNICNDTSVNYVAWTFKKKKKFFDIVTWTGNGTNRDIAHSLGSAPAMILVKCTNYSNEWAVYHKDLADYQYLRLNSSNIANTGITRWNSTVATSTAFTIGTSAEVNGSGDSYVAYLFADNSSDLSDNQMIKCGSYTGTGATHEVALGWEPQFLLVKAAESATSWRMLDTMRGFIAPSSDSKLLLTDDIGVETASGTLNVSSNGFIVSSDVGHTNVSGQKYIYMAIRAPMMVEPEAATDVFAIDLGTSSVPSWISGFPVDMAINATYATTAHKIVGTRLTSGRYLDTTVSSAEASEGNNTFDFMNGWNKDSRNSSYLCWMWKRAKSYMDVVCFSGSGSARTISHSLGVPPEMMWVKTRSDTDGWAVYNKTIGATKFLALNNADSAVANSSWWNDTEPTSASFSVGNSSATNASGRTYIAFLFATLAGISKVGSYSGNGTNNHVINCGFTAGARFILIKRSNGAGDWFMYDSVRGITSTSNDGLLYLNNTQAQVTEAAATGVDAVRPHASGFQLDSDDTLNHSSLDYIFYAIA